MNRTGLTWLKAKIIVSFMNYSRRVKRIQKGVNRRSLNLKVKNRSSEYGQNGARKCFKGRSDRISQGKREKTLVSRIFRAGSKIKNWALLHKGFRKPKSGARINKDTNGFFGDIFFLLHSPYVLQ